MGVGRRLLSLSSARCVLRWRRGRRRNGPFSVAYGYPSGALSIQGSSVVKDLKILAILLAAIFAFVVPPEEGHAQISSGVPRPSIESVPKGEPLEFTPWCPNGQALDDVRKCIETCISAASPEDWRAYRHLCIEVDKASYSEKDCERAIERLNEKQSGDFPDDECQELCCHLPPPDAFADRPTSTRKPDSFADRPTATRRPTS